MESNYSPKYMIWDKWAVFGRELRFSPVFNAERFWQLECDKRANSK